MTVDEALLALVGRMAKGESVPLTHLSEEEIGELLSHGFVTQNDSIQVPDSVEPLTNSRIRQLLDDAATSWIDTLEIVPVIASTNTALMTRAQDESINGHVLLAELQTQGRGRRGRKWISPFGRNVMLSFGFDLSTDTTNFGSVSLAMGVAVAKAIENVGEVSIQLKWPNDIYLHDRKLGGILIDLLNVGPPVQMLLGIGLNVYAAPDRLEHANAPAIALAQVTPRPNRHAVVSALLNEFVAAIEQYSQQGFSSFMAEWSKRDIYAGHLLCVDGLNEKIEGRSRGIDASGALQLETSEGIRKIIGGDVTIRRT